MPVNYLSSQSPQPGYISNPGANSPYSFSAALDPNVLAEVKELLQAKRENADADWVAIVVTMFSWMAKKLTPTKEMLEFIEKSEENERNKKKFPYVRTKPLIQKQKTSLFKVMGFAAENGIYYGIDKYIELVKKYGPLWISVGADKEHVLPPAGDRLLVKINGPTSGKPEDMWFTYLDLENGSLEAKPVMEFSETYNDIIIKNPGTFLQLAHYTALAPPDDAKDHVYKVDPKEIEIPKGVRIRPKQFSDADIVFFRGHMALCADGSPIAYPVHAEHKKYALERAPDPTKGKQMKGVLYEGNPPKPQTHKVKVPGESKLIDFYISSTSLHYVDKPVKDEESRQDQFINSQTISYFIYNDFLMKKYKMYVGDIGMIYDTATKKNTFVLVADYGPDYTLGEASIRAAENLELYKNKEIPIIDGKHKATSGLEYDESDEKHRAYKNRFLYVIFSRSKKVYDPNYASPDQQKFTATKVRLKDEDIQRLGKEILKSYGDQKLIDQMENATK